MQQKQPIDYATAENQPPRPLPLWAKAIMIFVGLGIVGVIIVVYLAIRHLDSLNIQCP